MRRTSAASMGPGDPPQRPLRRAWIALAAVALGACSGGDGVDDDRQLRIDGPAQVDPDFRGVPASDPASDSGG